MQLSRATRRLWLGLRSAAPLGALAIFAALSSLPGSAGVLPEDEMDAMYHRYEGGGVTGSGSLGAHPQEDRRQLFGVL